MLKKFKKGLNRLFKKIRKTFLKIKKNPQAKKKVLVLGILLLVFLFVFRFKHLFVVAVVNNQPITRLSLIKELEQSYGGQVLDQQISQLLIKQAGKEAGIKVTPDEIEAKVKELEQQFSEQGMNLDELLGAQGQTRQVLADQIQTQLMIEKILGEQVEISEEELTAYFEENQDFLPENTTLEDNRTDLTERLRLQKISEAFQPWLTELREKAKIVNFLEL